MTLESQTQTSIQLNRQDTQRRKNFVRARLMTLVSQSKHGYNAILFVG